MGIDYAVGKYLTFLDPDDKWEEHSFKNAYEFFEKHYDEIDVLAARVKFLRLTIIITLLTTSSTAAQELPIWTMKKRFFLFSQQPQQHL